MRHGWWLGLALWPAASFAGHGLLNSFNDLQWLPPPGRTPDQWHYRLDTWREQAALLMADTPTAQFELCLNFMRDKLADAEAMMLKDEREAAQLAITLYRDYRSRALAVVDAAAKDAAPALRERLARTLLEHQYMLSVDYPDLPVASRALLAHLIDETGQRYIDLRATLPRATAESLFFKEEEVRWSWEMGKRAGEEAR